MEASGTRALFLLLAGPRRSHTCSRSDLTRGPRCAQAEHTKHGASAGSSGGALPAVMRGSGQPGKDHQ